MRGKEPTDLLWWVIPKVIAGMPLPFVHPDRRAQRGGTLRQFEDDLPVLRDAGIQSVVCLLNIPSHQRIFEAAGFTFLLSIVPDYQAPTLDQANRIMDFIAAAPKAVAVHCEGGIGRTGTILAAFLIHQGSTAEDAIRQVRSVEPAAIETNSQIKFLVEFERQKASTTPAKHGSI